MSQDNKDKVDGASPLEQLDGLLALHRRQIELDLRVSAPGTVLAFNPVTRRADVMLAFLPVIYVEDEEVPQAPIVCPQVPVLMQGDAVSYVTTPILPGATGLVVFSDRCLARFLLSGVPEDPINGRTHSLGDGLFVPCPIGSAVAPVDPTGTVIEGSLIKLGAAAAGFAINGTALAAAAAPIAATLTAVPPASDPVTVIAAANANKAAILAFLNAIAATLSAKVQIQ